MCREKFLLSDTSVFAMQYYHTLSVSVSLKLKAKPDLDVSIIIIIKILFASFLATTVYFQFCKTFQIYSHLGNLFFVFHQV